MAEAVPIPKRMTSRVARVYPLLKAGLPAYTIGERVGLRGSKLTEAIRGNYRLGYVPWPPLEVRQAQHRANTSAARGGIALILEPFLKLDLTARQTQTALRAQGGTDLSLRQISSFYSRARHRHRAVRPTKELTVEAQRDKRRSERDILQIVHDRQLAAAALERAGFPRPRALSDWRRWEAKLEVRDDLATRLRVILPPDVPLPPDRHHREFLEAFWQHAAYYQAEGLLSLAYHPACYLAESESPTQIVHTLAPQLRALQQALHLSDDDMRKLLRTA